MKNGNEAMVSVVECSPLGKVVTAVKTHKADTCQRVKWRKRLVRTGSIVKVRLQVVVAAC